MKYSLSPAAILLLQAARVSAFWRMQCGSPLIVDRIDPLVQPNASPAKHVHNIMGGSAFDKTTSFAKLQESKCTSCQVKGDKSIYWVPSLYFEHEDTNEIEIVPQKDGMLVYYIPEYGGSKVEMFPEGFSMLAGDPNKRDFDESSLEPGSETYNRQMAIGFNCLNYGGTPEPFAFHRSMPDKQKLKDCVDGLRADITFPSCWNGENDSEDHRSHMAYPEGIEGDGPCPSTHKRRLITMKFETLFNVAKFVDQPGRFVWSTGDLTGYGYHGDFVNGWDSGLLQDAYNDGTCVKTRASDGSGGVITDCKTFIDRNQLQSISEMNSCKRDSITGDDYSGPFPKLPGCNPVGNKGSSFDCGEEAPVAVANAVVNNPPVVAPVAAAPSTTMKKTTTKHKVKKPKPTTTTTTAPPAEVTPAAVPVPEAEANPPMNVNSVPPKKVKEVVVTVVETIYQTVYHDIVETATTYVPSPTPASYRRRHRHRRDW